MSIGAVVLGPRTRPLPVQWLINHYKLDVTVYDSYEGHPEFEKAFPLKKVPVFIGPKGLKLREALAICQYLFLIAEPDSKLLGKTDAEKAQVTMWNSYSNSDVLPTAAAVFRPMLNDGTPYNKKNVDEKNALLNEQLKAFEQRLTTHTYLVGERLSFADIYSALMLQRPFALLFDPEWQRQYPQTTRWFKLITSQPLVAAVLPKGYKIAEKRLEYVPPKKEPKAKKEAAPKAAAAPKTAAAKEAAPAAEEAPKKPKHPLEALGKASAPLDEWKRTYSNEETREVAIPWFWKNQWNPEEWSLWKVDYKYNDELTLTFMSNNLVGGFFNRLSASTKYMFGCMVVYGENNNNGITGAFLVRGQDYVPAFDVAPDWESYSYSRLDPTDAKDKDFIDNMFAWDKPVVVNGEEREIADGKVLK